MLFSLKVKFWGLVNNFPSTSSRVIEDGGERRSYTNFGDDVTANTMSWDK